MDTPTQDLLADMIRFLQDIRAHRERIERCSTIMEIHDVPSLLGGKFYIRAETLLQRLETANAK